MLPMSIQPDMQVDEADSQKILALASTLQAAKEGKKEHLEKAAKEFESFMMSHVFKTMYNSIEKSSFSGNGFTQEVFMGMFIDESTKKQGMGQNGLAAAMMKQFDRKYHFDQRKETNLIGETQNQPAVNLSEHLEAMADSVDQQQTLESLYADLEQMTDKLENKISSDFGLRMHPIQKVRKFHDGIDFALPHGTEIKAPASGTVRFAGRKGGYGNTVVLDHGHGVETVYAHLSEVGVKEGDFLNKNAFLGRVGSTGISTGPHLHFEVRDQKKPVDPKRLSSNQEKTKD